MRVWGSGWGGESASSATSQPPPYLILPSGLNQPRLLCPILCPPQGRLVGLPRGLSYSLVSGGKVASLKELCLRRLHSLLPPSLSLSIATSPGLALHLVSVHRPPMSGCPPCIPPRNSPAPPHLKPNCPPSKAAAHCLALPSSLLSILNAGKTCIGICQIKSLLTAQFMTIFSAFPQNLSRPRLILLQPNLLCTSILGGYN